jgi:hypothetical protein
MQKAAREFIISETILSRPEAIEADCRFTSQLEVYVSKLECLPVFFTVSVKQICISFFFNYPKREQQPAGNSTCRRSNISIQHKCQCLSKARLLSPKHEERRSSERTPFLQLLIKLRILKMTKKVARSFQVSSSHRFPRSLRERHCKKANNRQTNEKPNFPLTKDTSRESLSPSTHHPHLSVPSWLALIPFATLPAAPPQQTTRAAR